MDNDHDHDVFDHHLYKRKRKKIIYFIKQNFLPRPSRSLGDRDRLFRLRLFPAFDGPPPRYRLVLYRSINR